MEEKKLKVAISMLGFVLICVVILAIFNFQKNKPDVIKYENINETKGSVTKNEADLTTSPATGDKETDEELNSLINEVISDSEADSEIEDIDITLSEEDEINQINNLFNENEL